MLLHCVATAVSPDERAPIGDWHGYLLLMNRRQYVLCYYDFMRGPTLFMTVRREIGKPRGESGVRRPEDLSRTPAVRRGSEGRADRKLIGAADRRLRKKRS